MRLLLLLLGAALGHEPLFLLLREFPCTLARTYTVYKCVHIYTRYTCTHTFCWYVVWTRRLIIVTIALTSKCHLSISLRIIFTENSNNIHYAESYIPFGIFCLTVLGKNLMYFAYQKAKLANAKENPLISKYVLRGKAWQIDW